MLYEVIPKISSIRPWNVKWGRPRRPTPVQESQWCAQPPPRSATLQAENEANCTVTVRQAESILERGAAAVCAIETDRHRARAAGCNRRAAAGVRSDAESAVV